MLKTTLALLAAVFFCAALWGARVYLALGNVVATQWPPIKAQIPFPLILNEGTLSAPEKKVYEIFAADHSLFAVIDTTGRETTLLKVKASLLMDTRRLQFKKSAGEIRIISYPKMTLIVGRETAERFLTRLRRWGTLILVVVVAGFSLLTRVVELLILGGLSLLYGRLMDVSPRYRDGLRAAAWGVVPTMIAGALFDLYGRRLWVLLGLAMTLAGTFAASHAAARKIKIQRMESDEDFPSVA